jgi:hypothetical protein
MSVGARTRIRVQHEFMHAILHASSDMGRRSTKLRRSPLVVYLRVTPVICHQCRIAACATDSRSFHTQTAWLEGVRVWAAGTSMTALDYRIERRQTQLNAPTRQRETMN